MLHASEYLLSKASSATPLTVDQFGQTWGEFGAKFHLYVLFFS